MTGEVTLYDLLGDEKAKQKKSTDWKWTFKDYPKEKNGLKVFSCFACGGGSTMGYKLSGCDVVGCLEIDKRVNDIYAINHRPKYNYCMDIREFNNIPNSELPEELLNLDILDGSPPCTTFSVAGLREKSWGKKKMFREGQTEQTLDDLPFVFIETVNKLKPKVVIMENVVGLLRSDSWQYVQQIYADFSDAGYFVHHWVLKGENMGIPQRRHRVFFVAIRSDLEIDPSWIDMYFNYSPVFLKDILGGTPLKIKKNTERYNMLCLAEKGDRSVEDVLYRTEGRKNHGFNDLIAWYDEVLPTLTAKGIIMVGEEKRFLSDLEILRMTTFPEDYNLDSFSSRYVFGMSVPPIMIKRIVDRLIESGVFDYKLKSQKIS